MLTAERVMPAPVAGIHVFFLAKVKTWMAGTSPAMTTDSSISSHELVIVYLSPPFPALL
jgi:hypothetical protein